ncbi:MAG TPA: hypothetical protein VFF74_04935 [Methylophilaceae bacterium]|nr:hypothetical protein [Methylophilaceae bacterium]
MSTALIISGDPDQRHQALFGHKVGDGRKVIPHDTELIVLITD